MAEPKKPSLTVLGGPMAGTRFLLPDGPARLLIGSDDSCHFQLALPEVAPVHARLSLDPAGTVTIHDEGSGLHVNDNAVFGATPLRNGDIVWLGTPGEAEVVMLQCVLPARAAHSPPPDSTLPEEQETTAVPSGEFNLADEAQAGIDEGWNLETSSPPGHGAAGDEAEYVRHERDGEASPGPPPSPSGETEIYVDEGGEPAPFPEPVSEPGEVAGDSLPEYAPEPTPLIAEPSERGLFVPPAEPVEEVTAAEPTEHVIEDTVAEASTDATVIMGESLSDPSFYTEEATGPEEGSGPDETLLLSQAERVAPPAPEAAAPAPVTPSEAAQAGPTTGPAASSPSRPAPPPAAAGEIPPRPPTAAPRRRDTQALPKVAAERPAARPPAARPAPRPSSSPMGLYAAIAVGAVIVLGGGGLAAWRFLGSPRPAATPAAVSEAELARASAPTPAPVPPTPAVEPTPGPAEAASMPPSLPDLAPPTPAPAPVPTAAATPLVPTPRPTPSPAATPTPKPTPKPPTPAPPSAEQVRAQQVAGLLAQGDAALAGGRFDVAIGHLDEVLRLDPLNAKAAADRARAVALRDASRRKFVTGRTIVKTEKGSGGLVGFEGADVKTPDVSGLIEFEMSPPSGLRPGDGYNLKFYLVNDGKKAIKIGGIAATTIVNGTGSGTGVASRARQVDPRERALVGEISGVWREGTTSWSAEIVIAANKADSLTSTLTWR